MTGSTPSPSADSERVERTAEPIASPPARPRVRGAAIVWGLFFAVLAGGGLWILSTADRRHEFAEWLTHLDAPALSGLLVLAVGTLVLIAGLAALLRRAQRGPRP